MRFALALVLLPVGCAAHAPAPFTVSVAGKGRPVVFIPDLAASGEVWDTTVAHLGGRVESHVITIAGFAGQPPVAGPLLPKVRDGLARYLRERHAGPAIVVGHVFGAAVAYSLAVAEPDLVAGVVAIDVLPCQAALGEPETSIDAVQKEAREMRDRFAAMSQEEYVRKSAGRAARLVNDPARAAHIAEQAGRSSPRAVGDAYLDLMSLDLRAAVRSLRAPVLAVVTDGSFGPEDWPAVEASWRLQIDPIPHHTLVPVRGSRHYVMYDAPEAFFAALDRFILAQP